MGKQSYQNRQFIQRIGAAVGALAAMVPFGIFGFTMPIMTLWEKAIGVGLILSGIVLGFGLSGRRPILGLVVVPVTIFGLSFLLMYTFFVIRESKVASLRKHITDYTDISFERPADGAKSTLQVRGKIVAVDMQKKDIDPLHLLLPDALRADRPGDVGIILQLSWGEEAVRTYSGGGQAMRRFCDVRVIDYADKPRLLHEERFNGGDPPYERYSSTNMYGPPPNDQIIEFLKRHSNK